MFRISSGARRGAVLVVIAGVSLVGRSVSADILGFGTGVGFTLNGYDQDNSGNIINSNDPATISGGALTITNTTQAQARSAFFNTPQKITAFTASFDITETNQSPLGPSDGFAFVIQNQGLHAVGGSSAGLGYTIDGSPQPPTGPGITAISPSAAEEFYRRNGIGATQFGVNGSGTFSGATPTDPVDLSNGDPIHVTLTYSQADFLLTETLTDLADPTKTYTLTRSADIADVTGTTAFVGFTGATGGAYSDQVITNFVFLAPEPASIALVGLGVAALGARRRRRE